MKTANTNHPVKIENAKELFDIVNSGHAVGMKITVEVQNKLAIARKCKRKEYIHSDPAEWGYEEYIAYLHLEQNGNVVWTLDLKDATAFDRCDAELMLHRQCCPANCYVVPAIKTNA